MTKRFYCQVTILLHCIAVCGICSLPVGKSFSYLASAFSNWSVCSDVRSFLREQFQSLIQLQQTLGISSYLEDTSTNLTQGALDALHILLPHARPSFDLLAALKRPFDSEVMLRTPSSSRNAMGSIHGYLMVGTPYICSNHNSLPSISNMISTTNNSRMTVPWPGNCSVLLEKMNHYLILKCFCFEKGGWIWAGGSWYVDLVHPFESIDISMIVPGELGL